MDSLYLTVLTTSFGRALKSEIKAITSVIGATIFAKQPLDDTALTRFPGVYTRLFVMYEKLLFSIKVMNISRKAHEVFAILEMA